MIAQAILKLLGVSSGPVIEYFSKKNELKNQLSLAKLQGRITLEQEKEKNAAAWAQAHIDNSGWKDEYVLIILSIPLVLVFIPGFEGYILRGFEILAQTPEWYRWLIVSVMAAIYGIKPAWEKLTKKTGD